MESETWRLFVALPVPDGVRVRVAEALGPVRRELPDVRWTRSETWHLTLEFYGETDIGRRDRIERRLRSAAARHEPFALRLDGGGVFRRRSSAVLWIGYESTAELLALARDVRSPDAGSTFRPHLTVGRCRRRLSRATAARFLEAASVLSGIAYRVERLVLFRSQLSPAGARHEEVGSFLL